MLHLEKKDTGEDLVRSSNSLFFLASQHPPNVLRAMEEMWPKDVMTRRDVITKQHRFPYRTLEYKLYSGRRRICLTMYEALANPRYGLASTHCVSIALIFPRSN